MMRAHTNDSGGADKAPMVSVGLPVYNGAPFLRVALDSLLAQTFGDFEIAISDNASTDDTPQLCAEFVERDSRVKYFRQARNLGLPNNWNFVAGQARGKYFKWASSNDFVAPDMLQACVQVLETQADVVLAFGQTTLIGAAGEVVGEYGGDFALLSDSPSRRHRELYEKIGLNNAVSGLIRREALRRTQLIRPYPVSDIVLIVELALQGKFALLPRPLLFRRVGQMSMTTSLAQDDLIRLHNPAAKGHEWVTMRRHFDLLRAVLAAPDLPLAERCRSVGTAAKHALWARNEMFNEFRTSLEHSFSLPAAKP